MGDAMNPRWLLRLSRLVRHPPSGQRLWLMIAVIAVVFALYGIEHVWGWPDWLTPNGHGRGRLRRF